VKLSTALTVPIFAHDASGDAVTGLLTGDWTKRISKASGAFAAATITITEMEGGFYQLILTTSHTDTLGLLTVYLTHASCKQINLQWRVVTRLPDDRAYPAVSGRPIDVNSAGEVGLDLDNTSGSLAKGTEITGFNDVSTSDVQTYSQAGASLALATYAPLNTTQGNALAASLALTAYAPVTLTQAVALAASTALAAYDPPTKGEMDIGFAALNDITVAEVWAHEIDTLAAPAVTLNADDAMMWVVSYISGNIAKASTIFAYKDGAGATLWSNDVQPTARTRS
jgi:hypothetical protein